MRSARWSSSWGRPLAGFCVGMGISLLDYGFLELVGISMRVGEHDVAIWAALLFGGNAGMLGAAAGWMMNQRDVMEAQARTIRAQLVALQASQQQLAQQEKLAAVGRLAAGVAHEVRNPLGVIRMSAQLLEEELAGEAAQPAVFIREEVDRLNTLVGRLLDLTRPVRLEPAEVSVPRLLARALEVAAEVLARHDVRAELVRAEDAPEVVQGDEALLVQLLLGLITNAAQATPGGRVQIEARGADGARLALCVRDDGPGIPEADLALIFDPFYTTRHEGTGLGLAMADKIARLHGASPRAHLARGLGPDGQGACVELVLWSD